MSEFQNPEAERQEKLAEIESAKNVAREWGRDAERVADDNERMLQMGASEDVVEHLMAEEFKYMTTKDKLARLAESVENFEMLAEMGENVLPEMIISDAFGFMPEESAFEPELAQEIADLNDFEWVGEEAEISDEEVDVDSFSESLQAKIDWLRVKLAEVDERSLLASKIEEVLASSAETIEEFRKE